MNHYPTYDRRRNIRSRRYDQPLHPNAADNLYFTRKAQEILWGILSGTGFAAVMFFLMALS